MRDPIDNEGRITKVGDLVYPTDALDAYSHKENACLVVETIFDPRNDETSIRVLNLRTKKYAIYRSLTFKILQRPT